MQVYVCTYTCTCTCTFMYYHHTCPPCFHLQGLAMLQCRLLWPVEGARRRMPPCPFAVPPCLIQPCLPLAASWMRTAVWALHRGHLRWERTCCAWCTMSLDVCQLQCSCTLYMYVVYSTCRMYMYMYMFLHVNETLHTIDPNVHVHVHVHLWLAYM